MGDLMIQVHSPLTEDTAARLKAGDRVLISGVAYVARDAAHKRMVAALRLGQPLPVDLRGQTIYYMGPSPARPGKPIGSAGPTTSGRMDPYAVPLLQVGVRAMIGKGQRSVAMRQAMKEHHAVYFAATGGAAALIAQAIRKAEVVAYPELGAEALRRLEIVHMPAIVANDILGRDVYEEAKTRYRKEAVTQAEGRSE
jgi:fumarate hydratase subunit beta